MNLRSREAAAITAQGTPGPDIFPGTPGDDVFSGRGGRDRLTGRFGDDTLSGGGGNDNLNGGAGGDSLNGDRGRDVLNGGAGADILSGGNGRDALRGGRDNDILVGGGGGDRFVFAAGDGFDTIQDFNLGQHDRLDLRPLLRGFGAGDALADFVRLAPGAGGTTVAVAPLGNGAFADLALLGGVSISLQDLIDGGGVLPVQLANRPPELNRPIATQTAPEGQGFQLTIPADTFRDSDAGDHLTMSVQEDSDWLAYDPSIRALSGTPGPFDSGTVTVRVEATDDAGASESTTFRVNTSQRPTRGEPTQSSPAPSENGTVDSTDPSASETGRFVAHVFRDPVDVPPGETFRFEQSIVVRDFAFADAEDGGRWTLFAAGTAEQGDTLLSGPAISADGRTIAFAETVGEAQVRVVHIADTDPFQLETEFMQAVSSTTPVSVSLSANGRFVAFEDGANVVVAEVATGRQVIVPGAQEPSISGNGQRLAYESGDQNVLLAALDTATMDVVGTMLLSANLQDGSRAGQSGNPTISADGRFVAFESAATNLVAGDVNGHRDIFVFNLAEPNLRLASVDADGEQAGAGFSNPSLSADGRLVAFDTTLADVDAPQVLARELNSRGEPIGELRIVSVDSAGNPGDLGGGGGSFGPSLSADGRFVTFASTSTNLVPGGEGENGSAGNRGLAVFLVPAFPTYAPEADFPSDGAAAPTGSLALAEVLDADPGGREPDATDTFTSAGAQASEALAATDVSATLSNLLGAPGSDAAVA